MCQIQTLQIPSADQTDVWHTFWCLFLKLETACAVCISYCASVPSLSHSKHSHLSNTKTIVRQNIPIPKTETVLEGIPCFWPITEYVFSFPLVLKTEMQTNGSVFESLLFTLCRKSKRLALHVNPDLEEVSYCNVEKRQMFPKGQRILIPRIVP